MRSDGTYVGRAAPEIDILEALIEEGQGQVSQHEQCIELSGPSTLIYVILGVTIVPVGTVQRSVQMAQYLRQLQDLPRPREPDCLKLVQRRCVSAAPGFA